MRLLKIFSCALAVMAVFSLCVACVCDIPDESSLTEDDADLWNSQPSSPPEASDSHTEAQVSLPEVSATDEPSSAAEPQDDIDKIISGMTLEEKIGQLFLMRCPGENAVENIGKYNPGGYILFARDFKDLTKQSASANIASYQEQSKLPMLIAVDEEGGTVNRVSKFKAFRAVPFWSPSKLYAAGGFDLVESDAKEKAELLSSLGINVNMAPVCDLSHRGSYMFDRSFSPDAQLTSEFVARVVTVSQQNGVGTVLKHFPGYGDNANTHTGIAVDDRNLETFLNNDLLPFRAGIDAGTGAILVSHNIVNCIDPDAPASLSPAMHKLIRETLGFDGVVVTDDLSMDAIAQYTGGDASHAAIAAVLAGNDLLCCTDYELQYPALLAAVKGGEISVERIEESVRRILLWKRQLGLL